jgi:heparin binding hemagglutinin HbhA
VIDMPTIDDVRKAGEQARAVVTNAVEQARTPLLAAIGAGDVATQAVLDAVTRARAQLAERAEQAKAAVDDLPSDVREKLEPGELRKLLDDYAEAAQRLYQHLTEQGEQAVARLRSQPQVKRAVEQFDQAAQAAQQRAESAVGDARELADEVLGRVVRRTRSTGEKAARTTEQVADDVATTTHATAERIQETGGEAAHEVRSTTRKAANRTSSARKTTGTTGTARKAGTDNKTDTK